MRNHILAGCVLAASTILTAAARAEAPAELDFGIISTEASSALKSIWEPLLADMSKSIGQPIKGFYATDYAGVIEAMRFNKVQVAWFGNAGAIEAVDRSEGEVFAHVVQSNGSLGYYSLLIVNKDSPLNSLDDLLNSPGKLTFGNGDPNSTSGFLIPSYYVWAKHGIDIRKFFTRVVDSNHEANLLAVANHQVDVATNNTENVDRLKLTTPAAVEKIKIIWQSTLIPSDPIVWRKDLAPAVKDKIKAFLVDYGTKGTPEEIAHAKAILAPMQYSGFVASSDAQLLPIRQTKLFSAKMKIENDDKLSPEEKKAQIEPIEQQLAALAKQAS
jgi:phosphonate transport system substrate-binding protein